MFSRIRSLMRRNQARSFVLNAKAWYQTGGEITQLMGDALHDPLVAGKDIGYVIDRIDRMLFYLGFYITDSMSTLRRSNPELARRFDRVGQQFFIVRNEMTVFLIRSQGPGPMAGDEPSEDARIIYYYKALDEVGFKARDLMADLDHEFKSIWQDLQKIISQEEIAAEFT